MNSISKKWISMFIAIILISINIVGCDNKDSVANVKKGRYVESEVKLPEDINNYYVFQMNKDSEGNAVLYASNKHASEKKENSEKGIFQYTLKKNGLWEKKTIQWLKEVIATHMYDSQMIFGQNGEEYFCYREQTEDGHMGNINLLKKNDNNVGEKVVLEGWENEQPESTPNIAILKSGNLLTKDYEGNINIYDKTTHKVLSSTNINNYNKVYISSDNYLLFTGEESANSISYYNENNKLTNKVQFDSAKSGDNYILDIQDDQSLVLADADGIHKLNAGSKMWETIVDGSLTSMSSPVLYPKNIIEDSNNDFYISYADNKDSCSLMKYSYNKDISSEPEKEISVYSLKENYDISQAVVVFQRNNPNIKVDYRFSIGLFDDDSSVNKTDFIKSLNTELLSEKGPDIIILDGLPAESYIEKGALKDLSNDINPMIESKELLPNIVNGCKVDGKIYYVPARFNVEAVFGNSDIVNESSNFDKIVECSDKYKGEKLFGRITYNDLAKQFLPLHMNEFYNNDKTIDKEKLSSFLDKLKIISDNCGCIEQYESEEEKSNELDLASKSKIVLNSYKGVFDSMLAFSAVKYIDGSFISYNNMFMPGTKIAINNATKNEDVAKDFMNTVLSTKIQDEDFVGGFPVNIKSLDNWNNCTDYGLVNILSIENADGSVSDFSLSWPDKEKLDEFMTICKTVSVPVNDDEILMNMILEQTDDFLKGNKNSEETANSIIDKTKVYLSE